MKGRLVILLLALAASAQAAEETTSVVDSAGGRSSSGTVVNDGSLGGIGGISSQSATTVKHSYVGQLYDPFSVQVTALPETVAEDGSLQLAASLTMDDGSTLADVGGFSWSVQSGPLAIDAAGLASGQPVYQDTAATAQASSMSVVGTLDVTVLDSDPDNFGIYAGDRLPDLWQIGYFGLENPNAAPGIDADSDDFDNLFEFAVGTNPTLGNGASLSFDLTGGTFVPGGPTLEVQFSPLRVYYRFVRRTDHAAIGLGYTPEFSNELSLYEGSGKVPTVLIPDPGTGYELVEVRAPLFLSTGRKVRFSRLRVGFD